MNIALAASAGGHLAQIQKICTSDVLAEHNTVLLTERNKKTARLRGKKYFFDHLGYNPLNYIAPLIRCVTIFRKEQIDAVITTGAEIGLVATIAARLLGKKVLFIETVIRVKTMTKYGRMIYPFATIFLAQSHQMARKYGKNARYEGGIL